MTSFRRKSIEKTENDIVHNIIFQTGVVGSPVHTMTVKSFGDPKITLWSYIHSVTLNSLADPKFTL